MKISRPGMLYSALPNLVLLFLFYSLAVHMWQALGGWPSSIGDAGFPRSLVTHGKIAWNYFTLSLLATLFAVPVAILVCLVIRRWRLIFYFALYAMLFFACWGLMQLAPKAFLNWWWD
jgi:hypothetical protein